LAGVDLSFFVARADVLVGSDVHALVLVSLLALLNVNERDDRFLKDRIVARVLSLTPTSNDAVCAS
jgi:hypothetical protein